MYLTWPSVSPGSPEPGMSGAWISRIALYCAISKGTVGAEEDDCSSIPLISPCSLSVCVSIYIKA